MRTEAAPGEARALRRDGAWLAALVVASLAPFLAKPYHIDDPMLVWVAEQILRAPTDFYGFAVNWHGTAEPVAVANNNPPLASFWIAAVGALLGLEPWRVHLGMMLPALGFVLGSWALGRRLSGSPRATALLTWVMPAALVSSTTVMSEALLLALFCGALCAWLRGLDRGDPRWLAAAAALAALAALTKYVGLCLVPLLFAYTCARERRLGPALLYLLLPVAAVAAYELYVHAAYGHSSLLHAAGFSARARARGGDVDLLRQTWVSLSFLGGSFLAAACWAPFLLGRRALAGAAAGVLLGAALLPALGVLAGLSLANATGSLRLQLALFAVVGALLLALAASDLRRARSAESLLLALWVGGVFVFAGFLNWTVSARALLPAAPAVALLLVRRLEAARGAGVADAKPRFALALAPALALALALAWADQRLARADRDAARALASAHARAGGTLWFQGAWGFQYAMQRAGAEKLDYERSTLQPGDRMVLPVGAANVARLPLDVASPLERERYPAGGWLATQSRALGAGFYSHVWGPLPFVFARDAYRVYEVYEIKRSFQPARDWVRR